MPERGILRAGHRPADRDGRVHDVLTLDFSLDENEAGAALPCRVGRRNPQVAVGGLAVPLGEVAHQKQLLFFIEEEALALLGEVPVAVAVHIKIAVAVEHAPDTGFRLGAEDEQEVPGRVGVLRLLGEGAVDLRQPAPPTLA